jgi:ApbE superfamily uncharacterized protein (UPF0280 family)
VKSKEFQPRIYRDWSRERDLVPFRVVVRETDLYIRASSNLTSHAQKSVCKHRDVLEKYIARHPDFVSSLAPLKVEEDAPLLIRVMAGASSRVGVGPMAAVAGALAEAVGNDLLEYTPEIIIENGGDIFLKTTRMRKVGVYAGESPLSGRLALEVGPDNTPCGIATSSGTVGHSISFGRADAAVVVASSAVLADAAATAFGNRLTGPESIETAIEWARGIEGLRGVLAVLVDKLGAWGDIRLVKV